MNPDEPLGPQAVVRLLLERVGVLEMDSAFELTADDFVLEMPFRHDGGPQRLNGDEARDFMRSLTKLLTRLDFHDITVHPATQDGLVVAEYCANGLTRWGKPYPNRYIAVVQVHDGLVTHLREYFDPVVVAEAFAR